MPGATVRISERARRTLRELAARTGEPMQTVLDRAVEDYRRRRFFEEVNAAYLAQRNDPEAWASELEERRLFEATLSEDLDDEEWSEDGVPVVEGYIADRA